MHRSRLGTIVVDCQADDLAQAAAFWSAALGCAVLPPEKQTDDKYVGLEHRDDDVKVLLQKVDHPSRVHLDIETDDIEAEVKRLEKLGARNLGRIKSWCVMEAPSGQRFCVVRPQRRDFESRANRWE